MHVNGSNRARMPELEASSERVPAYQRIRNELRRRIQTGELKPGMPIDSERSIAKTNAVSLMTARQAIKALESEGLVDRRVGAGTFVAPPRIQFNRLLGFSEQMVSRGLQPSSRLISFTITKQEDDVCARLLQAGGTNLVRLERVRFGGGEPFSVETCYFVETDFPGIRKSHLEKRSLFEVLEQQYGVRLSYADEEVDATSADARVTRFLRITLGAPLLRIRQTLYQESGHPLAYSLGLYRSDRHSIATRRFRQ
jgi:GntR family transcriptional regulator